MTFDYRIYTASDADEVARLLADTFSRRDPPAVAVRLTSADFEVFARLLCGRAEADRLSVVARSQETGEIAGALLAEDSASPSPEGMGRLTAKFDPIFDILGALDTEYRHGKHPRPGETVHLYLLGVAPSFAGKGVGHRLVAACLENAAHRGYSVAVTEATNRTSQHIFRKQGFVERVRRSYGEYRFDNRPVFASITEEGGPILMDRRLDKGAVTFVGNLNP